MTDVKIKELINEAMQRDDKMISIYHTPDSTSVNIYPYESEDEEDPVDRLIQSVEKLVNKLDRCCIMGDDGK